MLDSMTTTRETWEADVTVSAKNPKRNKTDHTAPVVKKKGSA